jgi:leader peptidase (prepilin peptidase) / N-methyltransferase
MISVYYSPALWAIIENIFIIFLLLSIGSFLTVCTYRIPRANNFYEDTETPVKCPGFNDPKRSICPKCTQQIAWWQNIPVVSWIFLGGRCYYCKARIPVRYPMIELLSVVLGLGSIHLYGFTATALAVYLFSAALLVTIFIDYDFYIIPDVITIPGTAIGIIVSIVNENFSLFSYPVVSDIYSSCLGMLAGGGFLYVVSEGYFRIRKKEGLGLGDVKLLLMTGALFGPECALATIFLGSLVGSIAGLAMIVFSRLNFSQYIAFGPYLVIGTYVYLFGLIDFFLKP